MAEQAHFAKYKISLKNNNKESQQVNKSTSQRDYWATGLLVHNTINLLVYEPTSVHFCTRWLVAFLFLCLFEIFIIKAISNKCFVADKIPQKEVCLLVFYYYLCHICYVFHYFFIHNIKNKKKQ